MSIETLWVATCAALVMRRKLRFFSGEEEVAVCDAAKSIGEARG